MNRGTKILASAFYSLLIFTCLTLISLQVIAQSSNGMSLKEKIQNHQWKDRVLLLCASSTAQADFVKQKQHLASVKKELNEQELIVLDIRHEELNADDKIYLQRAVGVPAGELSVVLIGKDGGVKLKQATPVTSQALFSTIDAMPMRRQERNKKE